MKLQEIIDNMPIIRFFQKLKEPDIIGKCQCGYYGKFKYSHSKENNNKVYNAYYTCPKCKEIFKEEILFKNKNDR